MGASCPKKAVGEMKIFCRRIGRLTPGTASLTVSLLIKATLKPMAAPTLDRVLTEAETLPPDDREILEELLRKRRIEEWRNDTAAEARKAGKAFRSGKLKAQSAENVIACVSIL
jgi:hypothetical protein